jgi:large subunit ribosomal protein L13
MIIDATDLILGRMATYVAKKALIGETIHIINAEKAVVTGQPRVTLNKYKKDRDRGAPLFGPYYPRTSEALVKRTIRGMLPRENMRGREALARIKCYTGAPEELKKEKPESLEQFNVHKTNSKFVTIKEISRHLGARVE